MSLLTAYLKMGRLRQAGLSLAGGIGLAATLAAAAPAAQLDGVTLPDTTKIGDTNVVLNGIGLRNFSMLGVHIYVAGLYLPAPSHDANAILASNERKMLLLHFVRDVPADKVRSAWTQGLTANCIAPCTLQPAQLSRFLSFLPAMTAGETVALVFQPGMRAYFDGRLGGAVSDPQFTTLILEMFLGPHPASPELKAALLGTPN